jgi:hypothetical protein
MTQTHVLNSVEFTSPKKLKSFDIMKIKDAIKLIEADGWYLVGTKGRATSNTNIQQNLEE